MTAAVIKCLFLMAVVLAVILWAAMREGKK